MPVVISELIIRAQTGSQEPPEKERTDTERQEEQAQLVQDVVSEVMRLLRREKEA